MCMCFVIINKMVEKHSGVGMGAPSQDWPYNISIHRFHINVSGVIVCISLIAIFNFCIIETSEIR